MLFSSSEGIGITSEKWLSELEWATEAVFTDPEDSSVWFYHSWLLGDRDDSEHRVEGLMLEKKEEAVVRGKALLAQTCQTSDKLDVLLNGKRTEAVKWTKAKEDGTLWRFEVSEPAAASEVTVKFGDSRITATASPSEVTYSAHSRTSPVPLEVLSQSLSSTRELLELEPDSKWTTLSLIHIMKAIGGEEGQRPRF